ncbi:MAG: hypothetical protein IJT96_07275 [Lachnospiraceae bacterium]|nr:hypothetical protein [Lachnospiraceae bacterium]
MKFIKKHRKLIIFFTALLVLFLLHSALLPMTVRADFGNFAGDTDYGGGDVGGSDSSGGDLEGSFGIVAILLGVVIFIILLIAAFISVIIDEIKEKHGKGKKKNKRKDDAGNSE